MILKFGSRTFYISKIIQKLVSRAQISLQRSIQYGVSHPNPYHINKRSKCYVLIPFMLELKACIGVKINKNAQNRLKSCNISLGLLEDYFQRQYPIFLRGLEGSKTKNRSKTVKSFKNAHVRSESSCFQKISRQECHSKVSLQELRLETSANQKYHHLAYIFKNIRRTPPPAKGTSFFSKTPKMSFLGHFRNTNPFLDPTGTSN